MGRQAGAKMGQCLGEAVGEGGGRRRGGRRGGSLSTRAGIELEIETSCDCGGSVPVWRIPLPLPAASRVLRRASCVLQTRGTGPASCISVVRLRLRRASASCVCVVRPPSCILRRASASCVLLTHEAAWLVPGPGWGWAAPGWAGPRWGCGPCRWRLAARQAERGWDCAWDWIGRRWSGWGGLWRREGVTLRCVALCCVVLPCPVALVALCCLALSRSLPCVALPCRARCLVLPCHVAPVPSRCLRAPHRVSRITSQHPLFGLRHPPPQRRSPLPSRRRHVANPARSPAVAFPALRSASRSTGALRVAPRFRRSRTRTRTPAGGRGTSHVRATRRTRGVRLGGVRGRKEGRKGRGRRAGEPETRGDSGGRVEEAS